MPSRFFLDTIKDEGARIGIPPNKNRALIREYLQARVIASLYDAKESGKISFIGGTSLRLLRDLDRFSEDLDFDNLGLSFRQIKKIFQDIAARLRREGFATEYNMKQRNGSGIGELKFPDLLFELGISSHKSEKLSVKINYTTPRAKPDTELVILSRFGFVQNVLTNTREALLAQKIRAIIQRKDLQPRDFYDVVWFLARNIHPDAKLLKTLDFQNEREAFAKLRAIFEKKVRPSLPVFRRRLEPFLINETRVSYLDIFGETVRKFEEQAS